MIIKGGMDGTQCNVMRYGWRSEWYALKEIDEKEREDVEMGRGWGKDRSPGRRGEKR